MGRNDNPGNIQVTGQEGAHQGTGAAKSQQLQFSRVYALLHGDFPDRIGHGCGGYIHDADSGFIHAVTQLARQGLQGLLRKRKVKLQTGCQPPFPQHPKIKSRIGHAGIFTTFAITGGTRVGTPAFGTYPEQTTNVYLGDGPSTGANRAHVNPGCLQRHTDYLSLEQQGRPAPGDHAGVKTGAAYVCRYQIPQLQLSRQFAAPFSACHRTGHDRLKRPVFGFGERHGTAAGPGD